LKLVAINTILALSRARASMRALCAGLAGQVSSAEKKPRSLRG